LGTGFGYRVQGSGGPNPNGSGYGIYQGPYGNYSAMYQRRGRENHLQTTVAGGLVAIGGSVHATRPVQQGYALLRVPGVEGVRGYLNNQEIGKTDGSGNLLIPNLLPHYGNLVRMESSDLPIDYEVVSHDSTIATPYRGGAVVEFDVVRTQNFTGMVQLSRKGSNEVPSFGNLFVTVDGKRMDSPVGREGQFYLSNLPPGRFEAGVEHDGETCLFQMEVPSNKAPAVELGQLTCVVSDEKKPEEKK
jgi:outer membrane usher protein